MTAISPLQSIHKKGIFGDHQKKNKSELLNILELKNLSVVQIVHYKKSKLKLENVQLDNLNFPVESLKVINNKETRILWSAPRTWLVLSSNNKILDVIKKNCGEENFGITDISHSRALIQIKGLNAKEVLKKGCPLNVDALRKNSCAGSTFHGITIVIDFLNTDPDTFNLITLRSFGESFYHHVTDAALEFGYLAT